MASSIKLLGLASLIGLSMLPAEFAAAEVVSAANNGFEVHASIHVTGPADKAFAALLTPSRWWSSSHTFSRNASNLTLDARAGGCWCENIPEGGSAEHMRIVLLVPGKSLRLRGPLGPLQGMGVDGALTFTLKSAASGTDIAVNYAVGGYSKDGFEDISKAVDHVLGEQMESLKRLIDG